MLQEGTTGVQLLSLNAEKHVRQEVATDVEDSIELHRNAATLVN